MKKDVRRFIKVWNREKMKSTDILQILNQAEEAFPVDRWRFQGIHVWPLIRLQLGWELTNSNREDIGGRKERLGVLSAIVSTVKAVLLQCWRQAKDIKGNACINRSADAVFLGDGLSRIPDEQVWIDRLCDPIIEALGERGMRSVQFEPGTLFRIPRSHPSIFLFAALLRLRLYSWLERRLRSQVTDRDGVIENYSRFLSFMEANGVDVDSVAISRLEYRVKLLLRVSIFFRKRLVRLKPSLAFVVDYPAIEGLAFCHACRMLEIPCAVIQHGVQDQNHFAYGQWSKVPSEGYEILPSLFWCWNQEDASVIDRWNRRTIPIHSAIIGGNPSLQYWQKGRVFDGSDKKMRAVKRALNGDVHVLISLQYSFAAERDLAAILQAMNEAPSEWAWWIRLHPMMKDERNDIILLMRKYKVGRYDIENATSLPLYAILQHVDVHLTLHSAVVHEAAALGICSVLAGEHADTMFEKELAEGAAVLASTPDAILKAVEGCAKQKGRGTEYDHLLAASTADGLDRLMTAVEVVRSRFACTRESAQESDRNIR